MGRKEKIVGVDFILPAMPWFKKALDRAQNNVLSFGSLSIPCLTVEDVLIAKFYSLNNDSTRFKDADDIKSIFEANPHPDFGYITARMQALNLRIPLSVEKIVPPLLLKVSKKLRKNILNKNKSKL